MKIYPTGTTDYSQGLIDSARKAPTFFFSDGYAGKYELLQQWSNMASTLPMGFMNKR